MLPIQPPYATNARRPCQPILLESALSSLTNTAEKAKNNQYDGLMQLSCEIAVQDQESAQHQDQSRGLKGSFDHVKVQMRAFDLDEELVAVKKRRVQPKGKAKNKLMPGSKLIEFKQSVDIKRTKRPNQLKEN